MALHTLCIERVVQTVKNLPAMQETWVRSLDWEDPLEKGMATHSSILAWRIPWREVQSIGWQRVVHDRVTFTFMLHSLKFKFKLQIPTPHFIICPSPVFLASPLSHSHLHSTILNSMLILNLIRFSHLVRLTGPVMTFSTSLLGQHLLVHQELVLSLMGGPGSG